MRLFAYTILVSLVLLGGCVERELTITSDPPGALVTISDKQVGRTPLTLEFLWYGPYRIVLTREGYKSLNTHSNLKPPFYEIVPLDLLSAMAPWTIHDRRYLDFKLEKFTTDDDDALIGRADQLRDETGRKVEK